jgi:hypothetical protein
MAGPEPGKKILGNTCAAAQPCRVPYGTGNAVGTGAAQNLRANRPKSLPWENFEVSYADGIAVGTASGILLKVICADGLAVGIDGAVL